MLVEPPRTHVPARHRLSTLDTLRLAAAAAALVLAVLSRGDAIVLALLLSAAAWRPLPTVAIGSALAATSWRWGSTSLEAISGAQAVLGPAGWVGPATAATASWLAALAVLLAATRALEVRGMGASHGRVGAPNLLGAAGAVEVGGMGASHGRVGAPNLLAVVAALAAGAMAAAIVAGPAPGGALAVRVVATAVAALVAMGLGLVRRGSRSAGRILDALAAAAGMAALVLAAQDAPPWDGTIAASVEGAAVALAAGALVIVGMSAMGARRA